MNPPSQRRYPSRSVRRGGKVVRLYLGVGTVAVALEAVREADRLHALAARMAVAELAAADRSVHAARKALFRALWADYRNALVAAGYHRVKRTWRRSRVRNEHSTARPKPPGSDVWTTDLGRTAREAWLDLVGGDGRTRTRAAVDEELRALQTAWADPHDPPVLARVVEAVATAWLEYHYFHARHGRAEEAGVPAVHAAALGDRAIAALGRYERLLKSLAEARHLLARADAARARAAKARGRKRRKTKKGAARRPAALPPTEPAAGPANRVRRFLPKADAGGGAGE